MADNLVLIIVAVFFAIIALAINFYIGVDLIQAWTKNKREYDYDLRSSDDKTYFDTLAGIRFGWVLALYKRAPKEYYYH